MRDQSPNSIYVEMVNCASMEIDDAIVLHEFCDNLFKTIYEECEWESFYVTLSPYGYKISQTDYDETLSVWLIEGSYTDDDDEGYFYDSYEKLEW